MNFAVNTLFFFFKTRPCSWNALCKTSFVPREKKISRSSALKVLDHAMIGPEGTDNCHKFVDILGLRTIFPLFMKSPRKIKKVGTTEKEHEGRVHWRSQPHWKVLGEMGEMRAALQSAVQLRSRLSGGNVLPFSFLSAYFLCMEKQPGDPWSRMAFATLLLVVPFPAGLLISLCVKVLFSSL